MAEHPPAPPTPPPPGPPPGWLPPAPPGGLPGTPTAYAVPGWARRGPAPGVEYAGFWIRLLAYVVDALIIDVPLAAIAFALIVPQLQRVSCAPVNGPLGSTFRCTGMDVLGNTVSPLLSLLGLLLAGVYFSFCWTRFGRTVGQRICGIRVVDAATGGPIPAGRAVGRYIGLVISIWIVFIGVIWAAFDPQKQGWHDKMASTFAVRRAPWNV